MSASCDWTVSVSWGVEARVLSRFTQEWKLQNLKVYYKKKKASFTFERKVKKLE